MSEWSKVCLGELIKVKHGFAFPGQFITSEMTDRILVTPGNFCIGGGFKQGKFKYFSSHDYPAEYQFLGGELIVTMTDLSKETDTLGYSAVVPSDGKVYLHNQRVGLIEPISAQSCLEFVYWLMRWRDYQEFIVNSASGTSVMHTSPSRICEFEFELPPLPEQKAIASVLSSLDDKIDLLHRQNKTLETMAETLFRQWFIEEAKEDWEEVQLKELVFVIDNRGKTPPYLEEATYHPIIEVNALTKNGRAIDYSVIRKYVTKETFDTWFRQYLEPLDIVLSTVGSIGSFGMFFGGGGCVAQNIIGLRAQKKISNFFLYQWLVANTDEIKELDIGSVQPSIKVPHLLSLSVKIPMTEKLEKFDTQVEDWVRKILANTKQIQTLENLRDTLLPKLMSGEVRVQFQTEEVA